MRDLFLLSLGDAIVGSWGSTYTLLAQELLAEVCRWRGDAQGFHVCYLKNSLQLPRLPHRHHRKGLVARVNGELAPGKLAQHKSRFPMRNMRRPCTFG